jgi:hypothetical protein
VLMVIGCCCVCMLFVVMSYAGCIDGCIMRVLENISVVKAFDMSIECLSNVNSVCNGELLFSNSMT